MRSKPVTPPLGATPQNISDTQHSLIRPVLSLRTESKRTLEKESANKGYILDPGRYGEFIFKVRRLVTESSPRNPKTQQKKGQDSARQELRMYLRNLAPEGEELVTDTQAFEDHFEGLGLSLDLELDAIFKSETTDHGRDGALRMALTHGNGSSWSLIKILEKRENKPHFKYCVNFLGSLSDEALSYFITKSIISSTPSESANLAKSLLDITSAEHVVKTLQNTIKMLLEDRKTPKEARVDLLYRVQTLLFSVMNKLSPPEINIGDIASAYKEADSSSLRNRAAKLLIKHFKENASVVFWNIANNNEGVTGSDIAYCMPRRFEKLRARRLDALKRYAQLVRKDAVSNLKDFVLREQDPLLVQEASDLLLTNYLCGRGGASALVEAVDKDMRNDSPSLPLACLFLLHRYREPALRKLFSGDFNIEEALLRLDGLYVTKHSVASEETNYDLITSNISTYVSQIGLQNLVMWMTYGNKRLRENAIRVFQHASDYNIEKFLVSRHSEVTLLRQMCDISGGKRVIGQKASGVRVLDPKEYGKLIQRVRDLAPPPEEKREVGELYNLRKQAKIDLKNTIAELAKNDVGIALQVNLLKDTFSAAGFLDLRSELLQTFYSADAGTEIVLLKMLLILGGGADEFIINALETGKKDIDYDLSVKTLKTLDEKDLSIFIDNLLCHPNDGMEKMNNLANSLLEITHGKLLVDLLMGRAQGLKSTYKDLPDNIKMTIRKKIQYLLINIMERMPQEDLDLEEVHEFYKMATNPTIREKIQELLIGNFVTEAIPVFLDVLNERKRITCEQISDDNKGRTKTNRARRMNALEGYACLVEKGNVREFRKLLLAENDPLFVLRTIDELLLGRGRYHQLGQRAVLDVIDEDLRAGKPSMVLACLAWLVRHKDYEADFGMLLKEAFSLDIDMAQAFLNLNDTWVPKVDVIKQNKIITQNIEKPGANIIVESLGISRLIKWMSSGNEILKRNAISVFNLVSDDYKKLCLSLPKFQPEKQLLKRLVGMRDHGAVVRYSPGYWNYVSK